MKKSAGRLYKSLPVTFRMAITVAALATNGCASTVNFKQSEISAGEKIGAYAVRADAEAGQDSLASISTIASVNNTEAIRRALNENQGDIMVLKAFMNAFPSRTFASVVPILKEQIVTDDNRSGLPDLVATGNSLGLDYIVLLTVRQELLTTGYQYQEQWKPELEISAQMVRVKDGNVMFANLVKVAAMPFDKYMDPMSSGKGLEDLYANLARAGIIELMAAVGPVVREIPQQEKIAHQKLQVHHHIREMASNDNCVIDGELSVEKTGGNVLYHVPCRDITLTYACESEDEKSRCWLQ